MDFEQYQSLASRTAGTFPSWKEEAQCWALGLTGESGEVADLIKKSLYHGHVLKSDKLANELGDVLWYLTMMAKTFGYSLEDIASANIEKLRKRYPDGFSEKASRERELSVEEQ